MLTYLHDGAHEIAIDHPDDLPQDTARMVTRALLDRAGNTIVSDPRSTPGGPGSVLHCMVTLTLTIAGGTWSLVLQGDRCTITPAPDEA